MLMHRANASHHRQILQDFSLINFYEMMPKLFICLREFSLFRHYSDGKERASGYTHNYQDTCGIDLNALSTHTFPSDTEMQEAVDAIYQEAENLWFMLGFIPSDSSTSGSGKILSISSWFPTHNDIFIPPVHHTTPGLGMYMMMLTWTMKVMSTRNQLAKKITLLPWSCKRNGSYQKSQLKLCHEDKVNTLSYAVIALIVNDSLEM